MRIVLFISIYLLIAFPLRASTSIQVQARGSFSGNRSSGRLQVETFGGLPWAGLSKSGSMSVQTFYPALFDIKGGLHHIKGFLRVEKPFVALGEEFTVGCFLDMSGTGVFLGGYTCILRWDTTQVVYLGYNTENEGHFSEPQVNDQLVSGGQLVFTEVAAKGDSGLIQLLDVSMQCLEVPDSTTSSLDLRVISLSAARTYRNLLGLIDISPAEILITDGGIPPQDAAPPKIEQTTRLGDTPDTGGPYGISTRVEDENLSGVFLLYRAAGSGDYHSLEMSAEEPLFSGNIPGQPDGTVVEYYIRAEDSFGNLAFDPPAYQSEPYSFQITAAGKTCDFNGDGKTSITDVIALLLFQRANLGDMGGDFNGDGKATISDAIALLMAMRDGTCQDALVLLLSAAGGVSEITRIEGLSRAEIDYLEQVMTHLDLTSEEEAAFRLALYGWAGPSLPTAFSLSRNTPNPFNPATTIGYSVPDGAAEHVSLKIYDLRGRVVRTLVGKVCKPGSYSVFWDGMDQAGRAVSSGVYLYRMQAGDFLQTRKMVLLK